MGVCLAAIGILRPAVGADLGTYGAGSDWPRFLGPTLDGKSAETEVVLEWPPDGPPLRWHVEVGEGYSMPSVARGRLFLFDRMGDTARLRCLDAETGAELWRSGYPTDYEDLYGFSDGPKTTPVVDGARVYTFGVEGKLRCHRVVDGRLLWEVDTAKRFGVIQSFFGVGSTPVVEGDLLIAMVGGSPGDSPRLQSGNVRGNGTGLVAFDKRGGEVRWTASDELASYSSPVIATAGGRRWGFSFARGGLLGFDPASGKVRFHFPWRATRAESVNASNPVIVGDLVFLSESYQPGSVLLRVGDGEPVVVWKDPPRPKSLKLHWKTPIHHDGYLYASSGSGSGDAELRAVELSSGKVMWKEPGLGRSTILFVREHLIVLTEFGRLLVVKATPERYTPVADVDIRGRLPSPAGAQTTDAVPLLRHPAWNPPILARGLLYARGKDRLVCLDLRPPADGEPSLRR